MTRVVPCTFNSARRGTTNFRAGWIRRRFQAAPTTRVGNDRGAFFGRGRKSLNLASRIEPESVEAEERQKSATDSPTTRRVSTMTVRTRGSYRQRLCQSSHGARVQAACRKHWRCSSTQLIWSASSALPRTAGRGHVPRAITGVPQNFKLGRLETSVSDRMTLLQTVQKTGGLCLAGRGEDPRFKTAGLVRPFR